MVGKLRVEVVARGEQRTQSAISWVAGKVHVVANSPSRLARLVVATEGSTRRNAHDTIGPHLVLHHHIGDARGKEPSHGPSFKY